LGRPACGIYLWSSVGRSNLIFCLPRWFLSGECLRCSCGVLWWFRADGPGWQWVGLGSAHPLGLQAGPSGYPRSGRIPSCWFAVRADAGGDLTTTCAALGQWSSPRLWLTAFLLGGFSPRTGSSMRWRCWCGRPRCTSAPWVAPEAGRRSGRRSRSGRGGAGTSPACRASRGSRVAMGAEEAGAGAARLTRCWACSAATGSSSTPPAAPSSATSSGSASSRRSRSRSSRNLCPSLRSNSRCCGRRRWRWRDCVLKLQPSRPPHTRQVRHRRRERISTWIHCAHIALLMAACLPISVGLSSVELMAADFQALKVYAGSARYSLARRFLGSKEQSKSQQQTKPKPQEQQKEQQQQILQPPAFPPPSYPPGSHHNAARALYLVFIKLLYSHHWIIF
jgi:hypothetical protein